MKVFLAFSQIFITSLCFAQTTETDTTQQVAATIKQATHPILTGRNVEAENGIITASAATAVIGALVFSSGHRAKKSGSANLGGWVGRVDYTPFREHVKMFLGGALALLGTSVAIITKPIAKAKERQRIRQMERRQTQFKTPPS
jgi:hypothetical protein